MKKHTAAAAASSSSSSKPKYVDRAAARREALGPSDGLEHGQGKKRKFDGPEPPKPLPPGPNKDGLEEGNAGRKMLEKMVRVFAPTPGLCQADSARRAGMDDGRRSRCIGLWKGRPRPGRAVCAGCWSRLDEGCVRYELFGTRLADHRCLQASPWAQTKWRRRATRTGCGKRLFSGTTTHRGCLLQSCAYIPKSPMSLYTLANQPVAHTSFAATYRNRDACPPRTTPPLVSLAARMGCLARQRCSTCCRPSAAPLEPLRLELSSPPFSRKMRSTSRSRRLGGSSWWILATRETVRLSPAAPYRVADVSAATATFQPFGAPSADEPDEMGRRPFLHRASTSYQSSPLPASPSPATDEGSYGLRALAFGIFTGLTSFSAEWEREGRGVDKVWVETSAKEDKTSMVVRMWDEGSPFMTVPTNAPSVRITIEVRLCPAPNRASADVQFADGLN